MTILKRLDSRLPRMLLATVIVMALAGVLAERVIYRTSIEAVVNAPRVDVVAPLDGVVDSVGVTTGDAVAAGAVIAQLHQDAWTANGDAPLGSKAALLNARVAILAKELTTLLELQEELGMREAGYRRTVVERLAAEQRAAIEIANERQLALEQTESMQRVDGATKLELAHARAERATAVANVERIAAALRSARAGIVVDDGGQDAPYSRQRIDQLAMDIARLRAERDALKAEASALAVGASRGDTAAGAAHAGRVPITAPSAGLLWSLTATRGERVLKGTTLATMVDCSKVYLEATVTPRDGDQIDVNKSVIVRFAGTSIESRGMVRSVRGGGVRPEGASAAELTLVNRRSDTRVIIDLDAKAIGQSPANFCQVGRHAKVYFDDQATWRPLQALSALTR